MMIPALTDPKNNASSCGLRTRRSMTASGIDKAIDPMISAMTVPSGIPLSHKACAIGTIPPPFA